MESFVIFFYGITNTWMERFGANPGDPYTTKQLQHISIAVSLSPNPHYHTLLRYMDTGHVLVRWPCWDGD